MTTTKGNVRENHVVEFEEGRLIAWRPAEPGQEPAGHVWRWELEPLGSSCTRATHTYDWTHLTDKKRFPRARSTTADKLDASIDRWRPWPSPDDRSARSGGTNSTLQSGCVVYRRSPPVERVPGGCQRSVAP